MVTYIWASPFKIRDYYLVGATPPFATFNEAEKALFEVVRAGRIRAKYDDVEVHPTHLEPLLRMYLEQNQGGDQRRRQGDLAKAGRLACPLRPVQDQD